MSLLKRFRRRHARVGRRTKTARRKALRIEELEDRSVPSLLGNQLFPADNAWNQSISDAPVAANSAAIINNIVSHYGDGRLHPDFGQDYDTGGDLYGIPYNVVHGNSTPRINVVIDAYPDESDLLRRADPGQRGARGRLPERPAARRRQPRRLAPDRLRRRQQRRLRVLPRLAAQRERRRPLARRPAVRLGHEDQHLPHARLDLGRRGRPVDPRRAGAARRRACRSARAARASSTTPSASRCATASSSTSSSTRRRTRPTPATTTRPVQPPMGARFRLKAERRHLAAQPAVAHHRPGHEGLRHDRRRQRQQLLLLRRQLRRRTPATSRR